MQKVIQNDDGHNNILIMAGAALSLIAIAIAIVPVNEVNAKQCNSGGDNGNDNNNSNDDGKTCNNQQDSKDNHNPSSKTPFALPMPFP